MTRLLAFLTILPLLFIGCGRDEDRDDDTADDQKPSQQQEAGPTAETPTRSVTDETGPEAEAGRAPQAPATALEPGDLELAIVLDEEPRPGVLAEPMERDLALTLTRNTAQGFEASLTMPPMPTQLDDSKANRVFRFDLTTDKSATVKTKLSIPEGCENVQLTYPIKIAVGDEPYLTMDLIVTKGLAWRIIGPFEGGPDVAHDKAFPPEEEIDLAATYEGKGGRTVRWLPFPGNAIGANGHFDLNRAYNEADEATAYATIAVYAPREMPARLALGSDDSIKAWHNGELIHDNNVLRGASPAQDMVDVTLVEGKNTFLLKVCEAGGGWGYFFELQDAEGKPITGLKDTVALSRVYLTDPVFRLTNVTRTSATVSWQSDVPNVPKVVVRKAVPGRALPAHGETPKSEMVKADPNAKPIVVETRDYSMRHTATVTGLEPGTRYLISADPAVGDQESERLAFYTDPPPGKTQVLHLRLICIIFSNVAHRGSVDHDGAKEAASASEIERIKWEMRQTQLFYYINSGLRVFLDLDYIVDDRFYEIGDEVYAIGYSGKDEEALEELVPKHGGKVSDYDGRIFISIVKKWDPNKNGGQGGWAIPYGGGGTIGPEGYPGYGKSAWRGGSISNSAWLFCHEFQHQFDALYHWSMAPEHLFCHFQPWDDTAHRHGEHWDGIGWIFWEWAGYVTREHQGRPLLEPTLGFRYFTNRWGNVVQVADADNDGVPDNAPRLPLDEKRFGSDPAKADTDGDGLSDSMEVMACRWIEFGLNELWGGDHRTHYCNPRNPDTDGDGLTDAVDPYPTYPVDPQIKKAPTTTGPIARERFQKFVAFKDAAYEATFYLSWNDDYLALGMTAPKPPSRMRICLDLDDDGWFFGGDNYDLRVHPQGGAPDRGPWKPNADRTFAAAFHNCGVKNKWPFYDPEGLVDDEVKAAQNIAPDGYTLEIRVPKNAANGLELVEGEPIGILIAIEPEGGNQRPNQHGALTVFEPHTFFGFKLAK